MGLFSDKKKTIVGFSYLDLGNSSIEKYYNFRRKVLFSAAGDFDFYQMSIWRYRTTFRRKYSQKRLDSLGFIEERRAIVAKTYNEFNAAQDLSNVAALNYDTIYPPEHCSPLAPVDSDTDFIVKRNLQIYFGNWYLFHVVNPHTRDGVDYVSVSDTEDIDGTHHAYFNTEFTGFDFIRYVPGNSYSPIKIIRFYNFNTYKIEEIHKTVYWAEYDDDKYHSYDKKDVDDWVEENVPYGQEADRWTEDEVTYTDVQHEDIGTFDLHVSPKDFYHHIRGLSTIGAPIEVAVPRYMYDRNFVHDPNNTIFEFDIAPMITLKTDNESVLEEDGETSETTVDIKEEEIDNYTWRTTTTKTVTTNRNTTEHPDIPGKYQVRLDISTTITVKREKLDDDDNVLEENETTTISNEVKFKTIDTSPDLASRTRRALKNYGLNIDSVSPYIENEDIDDFFLTLSLSPEDATDNKYLSKALFDTLAMYLGGEQHLIDNNGGSATPTNYKIDLSSANSTSHISFKLSSMIKQGNVANDFPNIKRWKVKIKQTIGNQEKFYDDVKEIYDSANMSGETTTAGMYSQILQKINSEEKNGTYEKGKHPLRKGLPSRDALNDRKPTATYFLYCSANEVDSRMEKYMKYGDDIIYEIILKQELGMPGAIENYHAEKGSYYIYKNGDDGYPVKDTESPKVTGVKVRKQIDDNRYLEITISHGKSVYDPKESPPATKHWDSDNHDFRIPVSSNIMTGRSFYELIELYDYLVCGIAFTKVVKRIKWYQTGLFATIIQIVAFVAAVVVTVATGGAGAGIGGAIVSVAETLVIAYASTVLVDKLLDALGVDDPYIRAAVKIAVALATGGVDMSSVVASLNRIADAYMQHELQIVVDENRKLAEQAKRFYKKLEDKHLEIKREESGKPPSRTTEEIIANIINQDYTFIEDEYTYSDESSMNITPEVMEQIGDSSWMVPPLKEFSLFPTNVLPEKGIIKSTRIEIPTIDISLGVGAVTFLDR